MATASRSIAEELLGNIPMLNAFQLHALVPYLSPEDATTIDNFKQSELAEDYYVETINLRYGKLENKNHLFDIFSKYCGYDDSTYTRLDILTFVAENTTRYEWNAHVLLKMHSTNLDGWVKTMTDCLNRGDELAIYALCDMLKRHAFVFTRTKPWTTVDASIGSLTVPELCMMCDVRLIYLGNNKFREIKCKPEVLSPLPKPGQKQIKLYTSKSPTLTGNRKNRTREAGHELEAGRGIQRYNTTCGNAMCKHC